MRGIVRMGMGGKKKDRRKEENMKVR